MPMTKEIMEKFKALDDAAAEVGGYVDPNPPKYEWNPRTALDYCKEHRINPPDLTDDDFKKIIDIDRQKKQTAA